MTDAPDDRCPASGAASCRDCAMPGCSEEIHHGGRYFASGAYRDSDEDKLDYEGFLSPAVLQAYAAYMHKHRRQSDGQLRGSDNWQAGIPRDQYLKSAIRHLMDIWLEHRGYPSRDGIEDALGGLLFNVMGYWFELLRERVIGCLPSDSEQLTSVRH